MGMANFENLTQEMIQCFKCENCEEILQPPISICAEGTIICGPCSELKQCKEQVIANCSILENIGKLLTFPCTYSSIGCPVQLQVHNVSKHESRCPFQQFQCPICLDSDKRWTGTAKNMGLHVISVHSSAIVGNRTRCLLELGKTTEFFFHKGEVFALIWEYNPTDLDMLWCAVKSFGISDDIQRSYFKLKLKFQNSEEYCEKNQIEPAINWKVDPNTAIKISIPVLRAKLQLKSKIEGKTIFGTTIEIFTRKPLFYGSSHEGFLRDIICLVCYDYMNETIFQCIIGHSFCGNCKPKLNHCPFCRSKIDNRNYKLEYISKKICHRCLYSDEGCMFSSSLSKVLLHEKTCKYAEVGCPLKSFITKCKWRGRLYQIYLHALDDHGIQF
ncbi:uncharacterized protein LOC116177718 [Photinus pyralis]|uniref:RING-type E3 ubiquitin transferase n=1 Tax=Photinus pyralis TaxID=7054 RepID=A0A1Y1LPH4_PHOPY|nr:uncharacterized protein LOC116177718 [Photinus pyralis]XP_031352645.1 uncharacterized protein LOC116177718 [Photinus pyralis]XP_031352646.1 uncharacterized protein LOC116177718 [Photinus pyralis]XP_031352647.1 uncharacterized protein LOC116177718 [Photinus pyralis]